MHILAYIYTNFVIVVTMTILLYCYAILLYIQVLAKKLINNYYQLLNVITITISYNIIPV